MDTEEEKRVAEAILAHAMKEIDGKDNGNTQSAIAAGRKLGHLETGVTQGELCGIPYVAHSPLMQLEVRHDLMPHPPRMKVQSSFADPLSFSAYVQRFKQEGTIILMNDKRDMYSAILNHSTPEQPEWHDNRASLDMCMAEDFRKWEEASKIPFTHTALLRHLQDMLHTIAKPDATMIIEAARTFSATRKISVDRIVPESGGDASFHFSEEVRGSTKSGSAVFPSRLVLHLPVFRYTDPVTLDANVSWSLSRDGDVVFSISLLRVEHTVDQVHAGVRALIEERTGLPVYM